MCKENDAADIAAIRANHDVGKANVVHFASLKAAQEARKRVEQISQIRVELKDSNHPEQENPVGKITNLMTDAAKRPAGGST